MSLSAENIEYSMSSFLLVGRQPVSKKGHPTWEQWLQFVFISFSWKETQSQNQAKVPQSKVENFWNQGVMGPWSSGTNVRSHTQRVDWDHPQTRSTMSVYRYNDKELRKKKNLSDHVGKDEKKIVVKAQQKGCKAIQHENASLAVRKGISWGCIITEDKGNSRNRRTSHVVWPKE